jgi:pyrroline-5-carboxylate reductase
MAESHSIGFLGAGKMATALARGFIKAGLARPDQIVASDVHEPARSAFARDTGARATTTNLEVMQNASVLFLAVKPACVDGVLAEIKPAITPKHLLISIAAGVPMSKLSTALGGFSRIIRVMPNTPALVGASASGFAAGEGANTDDVALTNALLSAVGTAFQLKENQLDAVTGLSGSGPAYAYLFIEAMSDGGVACGLPRDVATQLAAQTLLGSARMVLETGQHPGTLKDAVTSPGGTTIEGLHELEKGRFRGTVMTAVRAAADKSRKLGQG